MSILTDIKQNLAGEINKILAQDLVTTRDIVYPPNNKLGDLSLATFGIAKALKKSPVQIADSLEKKLTLMPGVHRIDTEGPYINFFLDNKYVVTETIAQILKEKDSFGNNKKFKGQRIMVEFAHPNPFKAFHIGHLRNIILGESLVRLLEFSGAKVIRTNYQGDVGMHIAKCLWAFKDIDVKDYPEDNDDKVKLLSKCYVKGAKAFEENEKIKEEIKGINEQIYAQKDKQIKELWETGKKWSLDKFQDIYNRVYTRFDREYMESEVMNDCLRYVEEAKNKGLLEDSQGAVIFPGEKYGLETRVFLNSQGLPTYDGKELGLAYREFTDFGKLDLCVHNVAVEQIGFFKTNFKVQELLDPDRFKGKQYHNAYEFVGLIKGKMSSRLGKVVLAEDVLNLSKNKIKEIIKQRNSQADKLDVVAETLAITAVKYAFLKPSAFKYLAFDLEASISFNGSSGPYINYTYSRIKSILKKAGKFRASKKTLENLTEEREIIIGIELAKFNEVVETAANEYDPSQLIKYLFDLSHLFNDYYHQVSILKVENKLKKARLQLIGAVVQVLETGTNLLGIKLVENM